MIYAGDQAIQLPVRDIYDTQIMLASINAARDMYERGQKQMEDFYKKYGDFFSPISSDMDWYDQNVTGRARDFIQNLYNNGVDPLRSAEGRALIQQFVNSVPVGEVNKRKQAAAAAQEYIKARGELEAKGLWNPEYEQYLLGGRTLETWDTARDGLWNRTSPGQYKDLNAATYQWFDKLDKSYLRTEGGYDYFGVDEAAMNKVLASQIPGFINSGIGGFHYEMAKRQLQAEGNADPSSDEITKRLMRNIISADSEVLNETRTMNPEYNKELDWKYAQKEMALKNYYDMQLQGLKNAGRTGGDGSTGSGSTAGSGNGTLDEGGHNWDAELYGSIISNLTGNRWHWTELGPEEFAQANKMIRSNATTWAAGIPSSYNSNQYKDAFVNHFSIQVDPQSFIKRMPRNMTDSPNQFIPTSYDIQNLMSLDDIVKRTEGFNKKKAQQGITTKWIKDKIAEVGIDRVVFEVEGQVYGAPFKNATNITPRQVVTVKILTPKDPKTGAQSVEQEIKAGIKIGPQSLGVELGETPTSGHFGLGGVPSIFQNTSIVTPINQGIKLNTIPNIFGTPETGFGNYKVSKLYGDSSQGVKYNGILY